MNPSLLSNWLIALGFKGGELLGTLHESKKKSFPKLHKQVICEMEERTRVRKKEEKTHFLPVPIYLFGCIES